MLHYCSVSEPDEKLGIVSSKQKDYKEERRGGEQAREEVWIRGGGRVEIMKWWCEHEGQEITGRNREKQEEVGKGGHGQQVCLTQRVGMS